MGCKNPEANGVNDDTDQPAQQGAWHEKEGKTHKGARDSQKNARQMNARRQILTALRTMLAKKSRWIPAIGATHG
jgi:hypothetical protein